MFNISPNGFLAALALRRSEPDRNTGHPSAQITIFNILFMNIFFGWESQINDFLNSRNVDSDRLHVCSDWSTWVLGLWEKPWNQKPNTKFEIYNFSYFKIICFRFSCGGFGGKDHRWVPHIDIPIAHPRQDLCIPIKSLCTNFGGIPSTRKVVSSSTLNPSRKPGVGFAYLRRAEKGSVQGIYQGEIEYKCAPKARPKKCNNLGVSEGETLPNRILFAPAAEIGYMQGK